VIYGSCEEQSNGVKQIFRDALSRVVVAENVETKFFAESIIDKFGVRIGTIVKTSARGWVTVS